jgi:glycosyltransferase involved in cell wall biosynthesis
LNRPFHILFLPRWYPHRYDPMPGLFIQRQAEALADRFDISVIYVHSDADAANKYEIDFAVENKERAVRVYYREPGAGLFSGFARMFRFFKAHLLGYRVLGKSRPDLVHVHVLTREGVVALYLNLFKRIPFVITEHWSRYLPASNTYKGLLRKWITRIIVRSAKAMIAVSGMLKDAMQNFGIHNRNFVVVPNPVDTTLFKLSSSRNIDAIKRFVHISCFEDRPKNISGLLSAIDRLRLKRTDFQCYFIGDGPEFNLWRSRAEEMQLLNRFVFFTGLKEKEDLVKEIHSADFMVLPSNYETFGTVVIESLACGIPVLATKVGIVPELITERNGIIIPAGDNKALETALDIMLDKCRSYDRNEIAATVANTYDAAAIASRLSGIYYAILTT